MSFALEKEMTPHVVKYLQDHGYLTVRETMCGRWGICDIVGVQFAERTSRRIPDCLMLVAVELKLEDAAGVLNQCKLNQAVANLSLAAMPASRIGRMRQQTKQKFYDLGIGLMAVDDHSGLCEFEITPVLQSVAEGWEDSRENLEKRMWRYTKGLHQGLGT